MPEQDFEDIYRRLFDPVYRYALRLTQNAHEAQELTQETFFKALRALDGFRGDSSLYAWLCGIAKNAYLSSLRRQPPRPLNDLEGLTDVGSDPQDLALQREDASRAQLAVQALPQPYREVFSLRALGGLGFRQIGELMGKSGNWACVVYHRARKKLNAQLEEET